MAWEDLNVFNWGLNGYEIKAKKYRQLSRHLSEDQDDLDEIIDDIEEATNNYKEEHPNLKNEGFPASLYKSKQEIVDTKMEDIMADLKGEKTTYSNAISIANERAGYYQRLAEEERRKERAKAAKEG
ncbi:hypothetical protein [Rummeliibacillus pycnus]|uniref:hypothetical protein n=1 Tax=Rummeliibacillus pycnus TaxID=101070 RepID=UPI000C9BE3E9|nr:hypothetical protein [Rummeliibacillus pycnus]